MIRTAWAALAALALLPGRAAAQDATGDSIPLVHAPRIVVTATRVPTPAERVASSITVVTRDEIERRQYRTVADALRDVPGIALARNGGPGGVTAAFLRGAAAEHTLVLVDGVEMNDPASPGGAFDLALLPADAVERIEVLRGPQSTLHGSAAMGGVIQVFTRRGAGPPRIEVLAEGGTFGSVLARTVATGSTATLGWTASASRFETDGISSALGGIEADGHERTSLAGRATWSPSDRLALTVQLRGERGVVDVDQGGGAAADDPNAATEADQGSFLAEAVAGGPDAAWRHRLSLGHARHDRESRDEPDPARPLDRSRGRFDGASWKAAWIHELAVGAPGRLVLGVETERESARTRFVSEGAFGPFESALPEESAWTTGAFVEHRHAFGTGLDVSGGARVDRHSRFGAAATVRATAGWRPAPGGPRLTATWGTGFKAPTLFQLFDPQFGNAELEAETSRGWDVGLEQALAGDRVRIGAAAFGARFEELVQFTGEGYRNLAAARTRGVETYVSALPRAGLHVRASHTYTDAEDRSGGPDEGRDLIRRPHHAVTASIDLAAGTRANLAMVVSAVGERDDLDFSSFPAARVTLEGHVLVRMAGSLRVHPHVAIHARLENALDADVEEVRGFGAPGRALYGGLTLAF